MPKKSQYSVHPGVAMTIQWVKDLPAKTGKSLDEWMKTIEKQKLKTEKERAEYLKKICGLGTNYAGWLAARSLGKGDEDLDPAAYLRTAVNWVESMFASKPLIRPLYEKALSLGLSLGKDVKVCPCKTMIPFYRNNVFAKITPSTRTRLDLGLCLRGIPFSKRLTDTGGTAKKDRITHNIAITKPEDFDDELIKWFRKAYDMDE